MCSPGVVPIFKKQRPGEGEPQDDTIPVDYEHVAGDMSNYVFGDALGTGAYAKVLLAKVRSTGGKVAVKVVNRRKAPKDYLKKFLPREIEVLQKLHHPNCVKVYEIFEHDEKVYFFMELAENGDLLEYINSRGYIPEEEARRLLIQLLDALEYCHTLGIAHRDLKCENLLLDTEFNIKVSDFGFATQFNKDQLLKTFCGSCAYASPEILYGQPYDGRKSDMWSIGVVLYAMVCGKLPFNDADMKTLILQINSRISFPKRVSRDCRDLIRRILAVNLGERITMDDVRDHVWCQSQRRSSLTLAPWPPMPKATGIDARMENGGKKYESQLPSLLGDMMNMALEVKPSRNVDKPSDQKTRRATIDPSELTKGGKSDSARNRAKGKAHDKRAQAVADANMADQAEAAAAAKKDSVAREEEARAAAAAAAAAAELQKEQSAPRRVKVEIKEEDAGKSPMRQNAINFDDEDFYQHRERSSTMSGPSARDGDPLKRRVSWKQRLRLPWKAGRKSEKSGDSSAPSSPKP
ncbi:testis-specific serine/threonine-protein kinase 1-like [Sycon ciliatum]|uniref:testis-specific serine/threonine-protein kinase 1-like n=1 Tax=Sycon ciliatum TaxID=27933 RepID=UPI0020AEC613|eukprot:scpid46847/ scgid18818/ Testis-specific serine/threonine-protein kinase 1